MALSVAGVQTQTRTRTWTAADADVLWTWTCRGRGRAVHADVPWTRTCRGRGRAADADAARTRTPANTDAARTRTHQTASGRRRARTRTCHGHGRHSVAGFLSVTIFTARTPRHSNAHDDERDRGSAGTDPSSGRDDGSGAPPGDGAGDEAVMRGVAGGSDDDELRSFLTPLGLAPRHVEALEVQEIDLSLLRTMDDEELRMLLEVRASSRVTSRCQTVRLAVGTRPATGSGHLICNVCTLLVVGVVPARIDRLARQRFSS